MECVPFYTPSCQRCANEREVNEKRKLFIEQKEPKESTMRNDCEISSVRKYAAEECYALRSTEIINFVRMEEWYFFFSGARLSECVVSWEWKAKAGRRCMWFQVSERRNCPRVKNNCRFIILCLVTAGAWPGPSIPSIVDDCRIFMFLILHHQMYIYY